MLKENKTKAKSKMIHVCYQKKWLEYPKSKKFKNFKSKDDVDRVLLVVPYAQTI
jgi:hypothetical protein